MKPMGLFLALAVLTGCELEAKTAGTQLAQGRDIHAPHIVWAEQQAMVLFDRGTDQTTDMHGIAFNGGPETVWSNLSTQTTWLSVSGYLVNEWAQALSVFSLASPNLLLSLVGTVDGLQGDDLLFRQGDYTSLVGLPSGKIWGLGRLEQRWFAPDGRLYYLGSTGILRSLKASDAAPESADRLASQFVIAPDQTHAVVRERPDRTSDLPSEVRDRLLLLPSLREMATLPLAHRDCPDCDDWLGFSPDSRSFYYAENHWSDASVVYQVDVEALEVPSASPRAGTSVNDLLWNPGGDLGLLGERPCAIEAYGCRVIFRSLMRPGPGFEPLSGPVVSARFSPDGKYLLFEDALIGGRLQVTSTAALSPEPLAAATVLSIEGSLLDGAIFEGDTNTVVFWAQPMEGKSSIKLVHSADRGNLYAATAPGFAVRRLAESVDAVAVGRGHALALVRFSPQDLTGDLVLYDLRSGREQILASPVSAFWAAPDCPVAGSAPLGAKWQGTTTHATEIGRGCLDASSLLLTFVVRGRVKSDKDGLWSLTVPL